MPDSTVLQFFLTQIDLPFLVTVCCDVGPSINTGPVHVQFHLVRFMDSRVVPAKFLFSRVARDFDAECEQLKLISDYAIFIKYSACHSNENIRLVWLL